MYTSFAMMLYLEVCVYVQNVLDERLKHSNGGVVLATVHLFLHLTDDMPHLHQDVYDRIKCEYDNTILYYYSVYFQFRKMPLLSL